jgi:hypothetical protein
MLEVFDRSRTAMTEGRGQNGARIARDRMLGALAGCTDQERGQSLWRAAAKYNRRLREEIAAADLESWPTAAARPLGLGSAREWMEG